LDNRMVDRWARLIGESGRYATINTYNETHAREAIRQYNRGFGLLTNRLACLISGWNSHRRPAEQLLFRLRREERRSPLRRPTPVIVITEDHRRDLKTEALDPEHGRASAYLDADDFENTLVDLLDRIVFEQGANELNSIAYARLRRDSRPV
ncbi:MAG: hypothetical protein OXI17_01525, partial [Gammaproteobacteria bacterium]|nr:hypothetical protein [Gammaproteobacteria bacterium]